MHINKSKSVTLTRQQKKGTICQASMIILIKRIIYQQKHASMNSIDDIDTHYYVTSVIFQSTTKRN